MGEPTRGPVHTLLDRILQEQHGHLIAVIETTGLADPAPVAQTFFVDDVVSHEHDDDVTSFVSRHSENLRFGPGQEAFQPESPKEVLLDGLANCISQANGRPAR